MEYRGYKIFRSAGSLVCKVGKVVIYRWAEGKSGWNAHTLICNDIDWQIHNQEVPYGSEVS